MIQFLLDRLRGTTRGAPVVFATTERYEDNALADCVQAAGIPVFRGDATDVARRHMTAARHFGLDWFVRVTGDCPFVDAESLDFCLGQIDTGRPADLYSTKGVFPVGIDYEVVATAALEREWPAMDDAEREHVTLRWYRPELGFVVRQFVAPRTWPSAAHTYVVDTAADYDRIVSMRERLGSNDFTVRDLLGLSL